MAKPEGNGAILAELLGLNIIGREGHDLKCSCIACPSSDAFRIRIDDGVAQCYSCGRAWSAWDLAKTVLNGDRERAKQIMVEANLFEQEPPNRNGKPRPKHNSAPSESANPPPTTPEPPPDPGPPRNDPEGALAYWAAKKEVSVAALKHYGAVGRPDGSAVAPMYGPDSKVRSWMRLLEREPKGLNAAGRKVGLFLPRQRVEAGEPIVLCEGVKDACKLHDLGILAVGLPGNSLPQEFVELFRGHPVCLIPDADRGGHQGAIRSARLLDGVASSVRIGELPSEVRDSRGEDVRDVCRRFGNEASDMIRRVISNAVTPEEFATKNRTGTKESGPPRFTNIWTCRQFLDADLRQEYLVQGVLAKEQPCVLGGRSKTLKTVIAIDLAISLGAGAPFLGQFPARRCRVGFWSGESGAATIRETAIRIAASKGVDLAGCAISWGFDLPKLGRLEHLAALKQIIEEQSLEVIAVDPLYLSLLDGSDNGRPADLFFMGSKLQPLTELGQSMGVTILLLHHFRKNSNAPDDEPAALEELSQAGVGEWARQWILLARRSAYQHDGKHELWMRTGGSAGHAGLWGLAVNEGVLDPETLTGRIWDVQVERIEDARAAAKENRQVERDRQKARQQEIAESQHRHQAFAALKQYPNGETGKRLRAVARLNSDRFETAIASLLNEGYAVECDVQKGGRFYPGYRPTDLAFECEEGATDPPDPSGPRGDPHDAGSGQRSERTQPLM